MTARFVIIGLALVAVALAAALGVVVVRDSVEEGTLEARALEVDIKEGKIVQGDLEAKSGEIVTLRVTSDEPWLFEIHGVEAQGNIAPDEILLLPFEATLEGRFEIGLHPTKEDEHEEGETHEDEEPVGGEVIAGYINLLPK